MKKLSIILAIATILTASVLFVGCKDDADSKDTSNATSEAVSEASSEKASEATSEDVSETTSEATSEDVSETTSEATSEDVSNDKAPKGYAIYTDGEISYFYPETWTLSGMMVLDANGNNVNTVSEPLTTMYKTMTVDSFNELLAPTFAAAGMTVSDAAIDHKTNANGVEVDVISFKNTYMGITMAQTIFCVNTKGKTYSVTVTEVVACEGLTDVVFDSLKVVG